MDNSELKALAEAAIEQSDNIGEAAWYTADCLQHLLSAGAPDAEFIAAANPSVVLGLIAENERLQREEKNDAIAYKAAIERQEELRFERDQLLFENKKMAEFKAHMVSLREEHGFDSWAAALVKIDQLKAENTRLLAAIASQTVRKFVGSMDQRIADDLVAAGIRAQDKDLAQLKAECEGLRAALTDVFNHVEGNTEFLVRDLVSWGTPRINPNDFYSECEAIKAIALAALSKGERS